MKLQSYSIVFTGNNVTFFSIFFSFIFLNYISGHFQVFILVCAGKIIFVKFLYYLLSLCLIFQAAPLTGNFSIAKSMVYRDSHISSAPRQQYCPKLIPKLLRTWQTQTILLHFRAIYKLFLRKNYSHLSYCQHGHIFVPCSWPAIPLVKSHTFGTKHPRVAPHGMYSPCLSPAFWHSGPTSGYLLLSQRIQQCQTVCRFFF